MHDLDVRSSPLPAAATWFYFFYNLWVFVFANKSLFENIDGRYDGDIGGDGGCLASIFTEADCDDYEVTK